MYPQLFKFIVKLQISAGGEKWQEKQRFPHFNFKFLVSCTHIFCLLLFNSVESNTIRKNIGLRDTKRLSHLSEVESERSTAALQHNIETKNEFMCPIVI